MSNNTRALDRVLGAVLFCAVIGAWTFCKLRQIDTTELLAFAVPVIGALFLVGPINQAAQASQQAAAQTNGVLDARIQSAVSSALAKRDAARTRQAVGDISEAVASPDATAPPLVDASTASPSYQLS
jgi:hypothetical protein